MTFKALLTTAAVAALLTSASFSARAEEAKTETTHTETTHSETAKTETAVEAKEVKLSKATTDFVKKAAVANQFEIDSSKLALEKSQDADIKTFAQKMVDDHTKAGEAFTAAVTEGKVDSALVPAKLDSKHQKELDKLSKADAKDFDKDYLKAQKDAHKDAVALFKSYSEKGDNEALKTFATNTLPTLEAHKTELEGLKKEEKAEKTN
jgi:putative membrane protein